MTGPLLRAAGEPWDLRKDDDYLAYPEFEFKIPVGTVGDGYDRYRVRLTEMRESVRIIEQASTACPRARGSPTTASTCCRRAPSSRPRWSR